MSLMLPAPFNYNDLQFSFKITIFMYTYCKLLTSTSLASEDEESNIQDLSKPAESIGILPIAEIIRQANLPYLIYSESMGNSSMELTTTPRVKHPSKVSTLKLLLKGTLEDIAKLPYKKIMRNLKYITTIDLPQSKKLLLWENIKVERPVNLMDTKFLKSLYGLLYEIPENEYIYFNVADWDLVNFFGTSKSLTRRRAAIIAYAMKHKYGEIVIQDIEYINKLKGLICGFSQSDLKNLTAKTFRAIDRSVLANLWSCTIEQMEVLLDTAQKPEVYGPYELWDENILRKNGLLVAIINVENFDRFYVKAFNGLEEGVVNVMSDDQCRWLSQRKLGHKVERLLASYRLRIRNEGQTTLSNSVNLILALSMVGVAGIQKVTP